MHRTSHKSRGKAAKHLALSLFLACTIVSARGAPPLQRAILEDAGFDQSALHRIGHEAIAPDPTIRRYTGKVTALGVPDAEGKIYAFTSVPVGPRNFPLKPDDLRGWRMTVLSGKRFGSEFRVGGNTENEIRVSPDHGPVEGLSVNDIVVVESIDANGASMFASPPVAPTTPPNGI
jgi:hypothetical protein